MTKQQRKMLRAVAKYLQDTDIDQLVASFSTIRRGGGLGSIEDPKVRREVAQLRKWITALRRLAAA